MLNYVSAKEKLPSKYKGIYSGVQITRFHPDYGISRLSIKSLTQTRGGFTKANALSATAQKWCSLIYLIGTLPATVFPLYIRPHINYCLYHSLKIMLLLYHSTIILSSNFQIKCVELSQQKYQGLHLQKLVLGYDLKAPLVSCLYPVRFLFQIVLQFYLKLPPALLRFVLCRSHHT